MRRLNMKTFIGLIALAMWLVPGCRGSSEADKCSGPKPLVIGVSMMNMANEYIVNLNDAMIAEAGKSGVQLILNDAQRSPEKQVQQIETFVAQKVDAIILNPCE